MDITLLLSGLVFLAVGLATIGVVRLKGSMSASDFDKLLKLAIVGVNAVEQIYRNMGGEDVAKQKYEDVKKWLESKNLKVSEEDIQKAIESAVRELKEQTKTAQRG